MIKQTLYSSSLRILLCCFALLLTPMISLGITLDEAKQQGWLGERPDGYLGLPVSSATPDTVKLMKEINRQRRNVYQDIAAKNGTALSAVEALAGEKAIEKTPSGQFIMLPDGKWISKP